MHVQAACIQTCDFRLQIDVALLCMKVALRLVYALFKMSIFNVLFVNLPGTTFIVTQSSNASLFLKHALHHLKFTLLLNVCDHIIVLF